MKVYFLTFIFILQIFYISSNFSVELIEELVPKYAVFDTIDINTFKIYKYIPSCTENSNHNKSIYVQAALKLFDYLELYLYDNFESIEQDNKASFVNHIDYRIMNCDWGQYSTELYSNLTCDKEYFFVASNAGNYITYYSTYFQIRIVDASIDEINISPLLSNDFEIYQRRPKEIINYVYNETKYAYFFFGNKAEVEILKNNTVIFYKEKEKSILDLQSIEFEKNENYTIYFEGNGEPFMSIQFFDEPKFFKVDFKNGPIPLYCKDYYYEIDISDYKLNDIILFKMYSSGQYSFRYQYKKDFHGNNFIEIGYFDSNNYIPIKKTIEDKSLLLYIHFHQLCFSLLNMIKDVEEINTEFKKEIVGPKFYYLDNFEFNNKNSIGIWANESFLICEQEITYKIESNYDFKNIYISKTNNYSPQGFKKIIIEFNSKNKILFEIKKFNYPIFSKKLYYFPTHEFFQLCQEENASNELYFYIEKDNSLILRQKQIFLPVFGSFDSYYIIEENIKNLSDFDFDKIKEPNFYQTYKDAGYFKFKCKEPLMLKHFNIFFSSDTYVLNSGRKYYLDDDNVRKGSHTFNNSLINKDLNIRITIYGLGPQNSIKLIFNNNSYMYTINNNSQEFNFMYENILSDVFHFELDEEIENFLIGEVIVGILPENINKMLRQIDFEDINGNLTFQRKEGVAIKIPKNFKEEFCNFSIIFPLFYPYSSISNEFFIDISYDKPEFLIKFNKEIDKAISPDIPLFQVNPYKYINEKSLNTSDKYFYIFILNEHNYQNTIYIKKPMIYSNITFNKINTLPQLTGNNKIYYYRLKIPEPHDNNCVLFQSNLGVFPQLISFYKKYIQYPYLQASSYFYYYIPYDKRDNNSDVYLNFYEVEDNPGYINFIEAKDRVYKDYLPISEFILKVEQIEGQNKLKIILKSLSYMLYPNLVKYYFITNFENYNEKPLDILSLITGQKKPNRTEYEFMTVVEDNGENEIFEKDIEIDIDLKSSNRIHCIPINSKTNLIEKAYLDYKYFDYKNWPTNSHKNKSYTWLIVLVVIVPIILLIIIIIFCYFKRRNKNSLYSKDLENNVLKEEFNGI